MSNFDINVDRRTDVTVRWSERCFMQGLIVVSLVVDWNTNFDINVELRHKC